MAGTKYTTFYLSLLQLACMLLKNEVYNAGPLTQEGIPSLNVFLQKVNFCYFYFRRCAITSDLDFNFERVLKLQQLLYFHTTTQELFKLSETIDDMKFDASSDTDSSNENTYRSSEENSNNVTFYRWQIVETKLVDVTFKETQPKCLKIMSKH